jgi:diguanylate cyclase (GGDEF)-like protein
MTPEPSKEDPTLVKTQAMPTQAGTKPKLPSDEMATSVRDRTDEDKPVKAAEWALVAYAGSSLGRIFPLKAGDTMIGRSPEVDVALLDAEVSRNHARIRMEAGPLGRLWVEDLASTNGTKLNGVALTGTLSLKAGDRLTVGGHVLKVVALDPLERSFHQTLLDQSTRDALTGLSNRAATLAELKTRFELALRHSRALSVVIVDLDHFKQINDTLGHGAGDFVLKAFGERVNARLRSGDLAGRIGGEEFLAVLSETDLDGAFIMAERLRKGIGEGPFDLTTGPLKVTCSIGIAQRLPTDQTPGDLIGRADAALYRAKQGGRNKVERG